jgi:hypothetical protein
VAGRLGGATGVFAHLLLGSAFISHPKASALGWGWGYASLNWVYVFEKEMMSVNE